VAANAGNALLLGGNATPKGSLQPGSSCGDRALNDLLGGLWRWGRGDDDATAVGYTAGHLYADPNWHLHKLVAQLDSQHDGVVDGELTRKSLLTTETQRRRELKRKDLFSVALLFIFFSCGEDVPRSSLGPGWLEWAIFDCSRSAGLMDIGRSCHTTFSVVPPWRDY
jgi:hypothetical protein